MTGNTFNTVVSYDDEESIGWKAQYVLDHNAAGLIIWEITDDFFPDGRTPLLDVIDKKFSAEKRAHGGRRSGECTEE